VNGWKCKSMCDILLTLLSDMPSVVDFAVGPLAASPHFLGYALIVDSQDSSMASRSSWPKLAYPI
jgi:hypothetical protein